MKKIILTLALLTAVAATTATANTNDTFPVTSKQTQQIDPQLYIQQRCSQLDANQNGKISRFEAQGHRLVSRCNNWLRSRPYSYDLDPALDALLSSIYSDRYKFIM